MAWPVGRTRFEKRSFSYRVDFALIGILRRKRPALTSLTLCTVAAWSAFGTWEFGCGLGGRFLIQY